MSPTVAHADAHAWLTWRPDIALRLSWSQSYIASDGMRRLVPAVPALIARVPLSCPDDSAYIGLQLSIGDLVAPIAELTMRPTSFKTYGGVGLSIDWLHEKRLVANLIQPRVAVEVRPPGVPRQIMLDVGVSIRTASPYFVYRYNPNATYDVIVLEYRYPWSEGALIRQAIELGVSIKYVP
jgi:hypothetical protein